MPYPQGVHVPELMSRSHTLAQPETYSHRYPTRAQMQDWVQDPLAYRIEYTDGTKATMLLMNGLVGDFTFAARLKSQLEPISVGMGQKRMATPHLAVSYQAPAESTFAQL